MFLGAFSAVTPIKSNVPSLSTISLNTSLDLALSKSTICLLLSEPKALTTLVWLNRSAISNKFLVESIDVSAGNLLISQQSSRY